MTKHAVLITEGNTLSVKLIAESSQPSVSLFFQKSQPETSLQEKMMAEPTFSVTTRHGQGMYGMSPNVPNYLSEIDVKKKKHKMFQITCLRLMLEKKNKM